MTTTATRQPTAAAFSLFLNEHQLMATHCTQCNALYLPPRAVCPHCHADIQEWVALSGKGTLAGFTAIHIAPTALVEAGHDRNHPYLSGIVNLDEGVAISARIVGVDAKEPDLSWIGMPVEVAWLDTGAGDARQTTLAFRLV